MHRVKYETLKKLVKDKANEIQNLLPPLPGHPQRCAPAHLWGALKCCYNEFEIKKLPDIEFDNCVAIIKYVADHPQDTRDYLIMIPSEMHRHEVYNQPSQSLTDMFEGSI